MDFYFAPLEGITGYLYRNAFHEMFDCGIGKYFTPFLAVNQNGITKSREKGEIDPHNNSGMTVIPQLLGNKGGEAADYIRHLGKMGYREVNLNLGCPYQTVVSKKKGAGLLADTEYLLRFLDEVFEAGADGVRISVKTRIGMESGEEFEKLLAVYNQYPLSELIVHPRVRKDFYGGRPDLAAFAHALSQSRAPVCYNGDIFTEKDYRMFAERFPEADRIMLGRGLIANPGLLSLILTGKALEKEALQAFHDRIYRDYREVMSGDVNVLFKMKELWNYMQFLFDDSQKHIKRIRKAKSGAEYEDAVRTLFRCCVFVPDAGFRAEN